MYDVIVIGAGPAGLQAGLTLGRMHRRTLVLDSGEYRNEPAGEMHNFLTRDGTPPAELRAAARAELDTYADVELRAAVVTHVTPADSGYEVRTADGTMHPAKRIILATGVRDELPDVPGLAELFGTVVAHCPFCHGHEFAGGTVVVQGSDHADRMAAMLAPIAGEVVVVGDGFSPDPVAVERAGATLRDAKITALSREGDGVAVELSDGSTLVADGFFVRSSYVPSAPFAADLDLTVLGTGCIEVDAFGRTSRPGIYAAGDGAHTAAAPGPMAAVLVAAASGLLAAAACVQDEVAEVATSSSPPPPTSRAQR
ncbi:MAG: NAD(P)/FAD-dependent oxidoreductase [Nocardioidaceae bacterium]|nr:NAD(P)/FAD-dependent oxidoreductase [Nocardioidaceae bacterium]